MRVENSRTNGIHLYGFLVLVLNMMICSSCADSKAKYNSYQEAARAYDFEAAHRFLDEMNNAPSPPSGMTYGDWEVKKKEAFDYIFHAEAMYLCAKGDLESINRLTFLLTDIPIKGSAIPEGTEYKSKYDFDMDRLKEHSEYIENATKFNQKCSELIDLAISNRNYTIVEKVLPLYKPVPNPFKEDSKEIAEDQGFRIVLSTKYRMQKMDYTDIAKKNAILKVNKAIRENVFSGVNKEINI